MAPRMPSSAHWVYTWNNPNVGPDEHHASFSEVNPVYHVFQREVGDSGTEHFQGYLEFGRVRSLAQLRACNPQAHYEPRAGNQAQAVQYNTKCCGFHHKGGAPTEECSADKRLEGPFTYGEPKQTRSTGMSPDFVAQIESGKRLRELLKSHQDDVRKYPRFYATVRALCPPEERQSPPDVRLYIGPPGSGKSRMARDGVDLGDCYIKPIDTKFWFDGYDLHPQVIFDDFSGASSCISVVMLLQLLDRYTMQVPVKGGYTWWQPETITITTNIHPRDWFDWTGRDVHFHALARRFTEVVVFSNDNPPDHIIPDLEEWKTFWSLTLPGRLDVPPQMPHVEIV